MFEKQNTPGPDATVGAYPKPQITGSDRCHLNVHEMAGLMEGQAAEASERTGEYKRRMFARWLYEHE